MSQKRITLRIKQKTYQQNLWTQISETGGRPCLCQTLQCTTLVRFFSWTCETGMQSLYSEPLVSSTRDIWNRAVCQGVESASNAVQVANHSRAWDLFAWLWLQVEVPFLVVEAIRSSCKKLLRMTTLRILHTMQNTQNYHHLPRIDDAFQTAQATRLQGSRPRMTSEWLHESPVVQARLLAA